KRLVDRVPVLGRSRYSAAAAAGEIRARSPSTTLFLSTQRVRSKASRFLFRTTWKQAALPCSAMSTDQARKKCQMRNQRSPYAATTASLFESQLSCHFLIVKP